MHIVKQNLTLTTGSLLLFLSNLGMAQTAVSIQNFNIPAQLIAGPISGIEQDPTPTISVSLPFAQFDSNLGTLDSVDWTYELNFEISATVGDGGGGFSGDVSGNFFLDPLREAGQGPFSGDGGGAGTGGPAGFATISFTVAATLNNITATTIGPNFDFFSNAGGGTHQIFFDNTNGSLDALSNATDAQINLIGGFSTLTFNASPTTVPEPSSILLGALSFLGLLRRRR